MLTLANLAAAGRLVGAIITTNKLFANNATALLATGAVTWATNVIALEQARNTANPDRRAALVAEAEKLTAQQLPWIPDVQPDTALVLGKGLTGAVSSSAYLFAPWANQLGGAD